ncbi:hypothetical protein RYZ27_05270 [Hyphomonas sp. FCG-A18]|uniref:hypothetical protein n=1 Tax=Hyphomonas sp. FCG-A18 TaxID=3080019 RepID=UPI002B30A289|nr:hypothetical protein RYZ27_05270 [Hyphomonas sp. FCG-A18]
MSISKISHSMRPVGSIAAFVCASTYLIGFAILLTVLAPFGYGTNALDAPAIIKFANETPLILILWNLIIYVLNAICLLLLASALTLHFIERTPELAIVVFALGLIWCALVLGAGMIANVAIEHSGALYEVDPTQAAQDWLLLHRVELGLGGGNEIVGGLWVLICTLAALRSEGFSMGLKALGLLVGISGLLTVLPPFGEVAGAVFGLGMIAWFILVGWALTNQGYGRGQRRNVE